MFKLSILAYLLLALPATVLSQTSCSGSIATTNGGRKIGIVIDSSGSMTSTDPRNLRITAGQAINAALITAASAGANGHPDLVTVIDFDSNVNVVYPLGDPASASFTGIDSSGGTHISLGVEAAIDQITANTSPTAHVSGIVVLTDGEDSFVSLPQNSLDTSLPTI
jgi:Mg-chelatase subunit ChlD